VTYAQLLDCYDAFYLNGDDRVYKLTLLTELDGELALQAALAMGKEPPASSTAPVENRELTMPAPHTLRYYCNALAAELSRRDGDLTRSELCRRFAAELKQAYLDTCTRERDTESRYRI